MEQAIPSCVNHRDVETRISCSACGDPICTRCMRQAAVGQKCPSCAKIPLRARALGRPEHYIKATAAGLAVAVAGGLALNLLHSRVQYGSIILASLLGFGVGRVVSWGAQRQTHRPFEILAVVLGVVGGLIAGGGLAVLNALYALLAVAAAGYFALRGLRG